MLISYIITVLKYGKCAIAYIIAQIVFAKMFEWQGAAIVWYVNDVHWGSNDSQDEAQLKNRKEWHGSDHLKTIDDYINYKHWRELYVFVLWLIAGCLGWSIGILESR